MPIAADELRDRVAAFPYWYHRIELPDGVTTPGWAPILPESYRLPASLEGKRVLDIGAWDGYWTFESLRRGAREVLAIDDFSDNVGHLDTSARKAWATFDLCREALGHGVDVCDRRELTVYDLDPADVGMFDVVLFFGTLYHLRYPMLALDKLSAVCRGEVYIESAILDDFSPYRGGIGKGYGGGQFVAEFYPGKEYANNHTNWWVPTLHCMGAMTHAAGFAHVEGWKLTDQPRELPHCRGFVYGKKAAQPS